MADNKDAGPANEAPEAPITKEEVKAAPVVPAAVIQAAQPDVVAAPDPDDGDLITTSGYPAYVRVGSGEMPLTDLVKQAKKDSGLTAAKWNALAPRDRDPYIRTTVDRLTEEDRKAFEKASTGAPSSDTRVEVKDTRIHADRGIGGRYVAIGGGERIRVADASTHPEMVLKSDEELAAEAQV